ncbi:MAG: zinc ribbon domain-containing protein [Gammaproteobacteria bacterium]|nr:zinc ribbon domain-containing protein [Gammaproteobacteria bacterium]
MPTYDYRCTACAAVFEVVQPISAPHPDCPRCAAPARRVILRAPVMHGTAASGREAAARSLPECGRGCRCCP